MRVRKRGGGKERKRKRHGGLNGGYLERIWDSCRLDRLGIPWGRCGLPRTRAFRIWRQISVGMQRCRARTKERGETREMRECVPSSPFACVDRDTVDDRWRRREDEKCVVHGAFKITTSMRRARRPRFEAQWRLIMAA